MRVKISNMKKFAFATLMVCSLLGCSKFKQQRMEGVIAEYHGEYITQEEMNSLTVGLSPEDSARVADQYIHQWVTNMLVWNEAKSLSSKEIERKVADYHRSLCLYEWEQRVVNQRISQIVEDSMVMQFYEDNKNHFVLNDAIVEGAILVVPNGAPNMDGLRNHISRLENEADIEWVEKFAYQYATGYELFIGDWKTGDQLLQRVPVEAKTFHKQLKQKQQIEVQDSLNTYLLQVTQVYHAGDYAPLDYVRSDIEKMLLSQRQVEFLHELRDKLYNKAIQQGELKIYE